MRCLLVLAAALLVAGCGGDTRARVDDTQARGDRLVVELQEAYTDQIDGVAFENAPPLDPPLLFIDLDSSMDPEAQRRFLCEQVKPKVQTAGGGIGATVSYGWHMSEDCP